METTAQRKYRGEIDTEKFAGAVTRRRGKLTQAEAAYFADIGTETLRRAETGMPIDLPSYIRICRWIGVDVGSFVINNRPLKAG